MDVMGDLFINDAPASTMVPGCLGPSRSTGMNCKDITISLCPTWNGTIPLSEHVTVEDYREVVQFWQEAVMGWANAQGENDLLRQRIAIIEAQVAQSGV